jgi:hypothetical protein
VVARWSKKCRALWSALGAVIGQSRRICTTEQARITPSSSVAAKVFDEQLIGLLRTEVAEVQTAEGKLYVSVAITPHQQSTKLAR